MYTPTKGRYKRFKRVISDNSPPEPPDNDEETEWNGFSSDPESLNDMAIDSPASPDGHQSENRGFHPESSPLESSQPFVDALEYQPDDNEMDNTLSEPQELSFSDSSYELPSPVPADAFDLPPGFEYDRVTPSIDDENDVEPVILKRGKKRNATFVSRPNGELLHPFLQWEVDTASMDKYMPEYAKQEGFAVNRLSEHKGTVIRWRCMHGGKYSNHRNLSAEVGKCTSPTTQCC